MTTALVSGLSVVTRSKGQARLEAHRVGDCWVRLHNVPGKMIYLTEKTLKGIRKSTQIAQGYVTAIQVAAGNLHGALEGVVVA